MFLTPEDKQTVKKAAQKATELIEAFKYIIHSPDALQLTPKECAHVGQLIHPERDQAFWESCIDMEPDAPREGFFARYIRTSSQHYKPKDYSNNLKTLSAWLAKVPHQGQSSEASFADDIDMKKVFVALSDIQSRLMVDGGKNSFKLFDPTDEDDRKRVEKKARKAGQTIEQYIDSYNTQIHKQAIFNKQSVEDYIEKKMNRGVNRRKDVLQVLIAEIADSVKEIKRILYPQMLPIAGTGHSTGQGL